MRTEFTHCLPKRGGLSRQIFELEIQAGIDHANYVINHPQLFSEAMVRFKLEERQLLQDLRGHRSLQNI